MWGVVSSLVLCSDCMFSLRLLVRFAAIACSLYSDSLISLQRLLVRFVEIARSLHGDCLLSLQRSFVIFIAIICYLYSDHL